MRKKNSPQRRFQIYSLRLRLILAVVCVTFFSMGLTAYFSSRTIKNEINGSCAREIDTSLATCNLFLKHRLESLETTTQGFARDNICRTTLHFEVLPQLQEHIAELCAYHKLSFLAVTAADGRLVAFAPAFEADAPPLTLADHPLTQAALKGEKCAAFNQEEIGFLKDELENKLQKRDHEPLLLIESAAPIKIRNQLIGTVLSGIMLNENQAILQEMRTVSQNDGLILLVGQQMILHNLNKITSADTSTHAFQVPIDYRRADPQSLGLSSLHCPSADKNYYLGYSFISNLLNRKIGVLVTLVNADKKMAQFNAGILHMGAIFGGTLLLAIILAIIIANSIARPIEQLSLAMKELGRGNLATQVKISRPDEIGALSLGFNRMATLINQQFEKLTDEIAQRQKTEMELAAEKRHLSVTLTSIADGVIAVDEQKKILFMNPAAEKITGRDAAAATGKPLAEILTLINQSGEPETDIFDGRSKATPQKNQPITAQDTHLQTKDGDVRLISHTAAPIVNHGVILGMVVVFRDITERRALQNELNKGQKLESLGILAGGLAHDFNNLLTAIMGNISLAMLKINAKTEILKYLQSAESAALRARDITQQLLTFSRGGAPVKELAAIEGIIRESADFCLRGSNCKCRFFFAPGLSNAEIDKGQFSQVIHNLIINATQAMPQGGIIDISAENMALTDQRPAALPSGNYLKITIADQGSGIPENIREKIFDPFFTTKKKGSGLGLASSYTIIKNHGGHILIAKTSTQGTSFAVYLPAASGKIALPANPARTFFKGHGRILLLDDEDMLRETATAILKYLGYEVDPVADGSAAITAYKRSLEQNQPYALLIFDLTIPGGLGGTETLRQILTLNPRARAIVSSGYSNDPVMADFADYGFIDRIAKPYTVAKLTEVLQRCNPNA